MMRKVIRIDEEKCNGCALCAEACHEGAIGMVDGKAKLLREDHCDGIGDCLPVCEMGAISFETREVSETATPILRQWPVQIKLVPVNAPYFDGARLLIAADCTAYAHKDFHGALMKGKIVLIGCPKLDAGDYADKLTAILQQNAIKSVTVVRMEVPCCCGIERATVRALEACGKMIPWQVITLSIDGQVIE